MDSDEQKITHADRFYLLHTTCVKYVEQDKEFMLVVFVFVFFFNLDSHFQKKLLYLLQWKPFKNDKKSFYFILKALFFLKIFKVLYWLFGHVEKTDWSEI